MGYTFNDILVACWAKATRLYFEEKVPGKDFGPIGLLMGPSIRETPEIRNQVLTSVIKNVLPKDP